MLVPLLSWLLYQPLSPLGEWPLGPHCMGGRERGEEWRGVGGGGRLRGEGREVREGRGEGGERL